MKDITILPHKTVTLSHRVYFLRSKGDNLFGCCSREGIVTLLDASFNIKNVFDCSEVIKKEKGSITVFELHSVDDVFCIGSEDEYRIYDLSGKLLCSIQERVDGVHYTEGSNVAWIVKRIDSESKEVCLIIDNIKQDSIVVEDHLYESAVEFYPLPEPGKICMMFLAGQDGMMSYFLTNDNGKIVYERIDDLEEIAGMSFSDDNSKFLSVSPYDLDRITCYAYPSLDIVNEYELDEEQMEDEEIQLGFNSLFIDSRYAIAEIGENLYYVLDTDKMKVKARFVITGHEPKPVSFYWPTLKGDDGETTNLSFFYKTRNYLISPFKGLPADSDDNSLIVLRINDIKEQLRSTLA